MAWVESLQKAIDYIEDHLLDDMTIEQIALQANSSQFHFHRTFSILTDMTVGEYIRRRRLTLAAQELIRTNEKIIDLALKYGYDSPEAFSKAFRRQHGISPTEARKKMGKLKSYNRLVIQVSLKGAEPMQYKIVERESFQVVGVKESFSCENGENLIGIPKMWEKVHQEGIVDTLVKVNDGTLKGILGVCDPLSNRVINYWVATASESEGSNGLENLTIPASKWSVFEVHGPMPDAMQNAWKKIVSEWFPSSGYAHAGTPDLEVYTDDNPSSPDCYSEIWIPVK
ncbi:AraC family transcriptional regulator [Bacillus sp. FJAT-49732]|uniref:AraC family transcriptional regulator n=1 Tax=Lederbergia citrisecunda TaxID=2833583 RepID=A0A942YLP6_9BACI|nr:AraC family transcriptional regulator [Lederbergia citrisecunda]MBS4198546.1 AraC family transcriptional regulator [Lederbergia citrisecunda]